jgi:DNA-binding response OmpR family regulator
VVLFVDDNRELCEALTEFLSLQGLAIQCAANGSEALRLLADAQTRPALIFFRPGDAGTRWLGVSRRARQESASCRRSCRDTNANRLTQQGVTNDRIDSGAISDGATGR